MLGSEWAWERMTMTHQMAVLAQSPPARGITFLVALDSSLSQYTDGNSLCSLTSSVGMDC